MKFKELKKLIRTIFIITIIAVVSMVGTTLYGISALDSQHRITFEDNEAAAQKATEMVKKVYPALVGIYTELKDGVGYGSGFIYRIEGDTVFIMTNAHVAIGRKEPVVYFSNKSKTQAKLLGKDENRDVAVITVPKSSLPEGTKTVDFGDSDKLSLAEPVVAIGNPIDPEFFGTTTSGVVSGVSRLFRLETVSQKKVYYQDFVQIDAAINHGNSGGPLFNLAGQIVGMNSIGIESINNKPVSNMAFAIPSSTMKALVKDLEAKSEIGIVISGITPTDSVGVKNDDVTSDVERVDGMKVRRIDEGSVAATAGLKKGDIVTKIDDTEIHSTHDFMRIIINKKKGDKSKIVYTRDGGSRDAVIEFTEVAQ